MNLIAFERPYLFRYFLVLFVIAESVKFLIISDAHLNVGFCLVLWLHFKRQFCVNVRAIGRQMFAFFCIVLHFPNGIEDPHHIVAGEVVMIGLCGGIDREDDGGGD